VSIPWSKDHYHLRDGKVRWGGYEVKHADPNTFDPLNHIWARDAKHVYTQDSINKLADVKTFEVLNEIYARDKNHAFYLSGVIKEADAATFRVLDPGFFMDDNLTRHQGFACDATQIFHYALTIGKPCVLRGADPATFQVLPRCHGRDAKSGYFEKYRLKGSRAQAFRSLNDYFAADDRSVFYCDRAIPEADAASFGIFGQNWAKDRHRVYFQDKIVAADPATIELIAGNFARDAQRVYGFLGQVLEGADPETFEQAGDARSLYFKDKSRVYYIGYPGGWVDGADPQTFQVVGNTDGRDARSHYRNGKRVAA
jgi:hypothetical protein